jgi:hypothetical protein
LVAAVAACAKANRSQNRKMSLSQNDLLMMALAYKMMDDQRRRSGLPRQLYITDAHKTIMETFRAWKTSDDTQPPADLEAKLKKLNQDELKVLLKENKQLVGGKKAEQIARLLAGEPRPANKRKRGPRTGMTKKQINEMFGDNCSKVVLVFVVFQHLLRDS